MKVLILTCNTGEGHNHAAYAVAEELEKRNIEYEISDPVSFKSEKAKSFVADTYNKMIKKVPRTFNAIYKLGEVYSRSSLPSPVYFANSLYAEKLMNYILDNGFDRIVCTHLYAMESMTAIEKKFGCHIPCFGILTDYTCIPFFDEVLLDGYFIPHEDIRAEIVKRGVPTEKIISSGIPVAAKFSVHPDKTETRARLQIPDDKPMLLIMGGGVGCGNIGKICEELIKSEFDCNVYVMTGRNLELKDKIDRKYGHTGIIKTVPYTNDVDLYMSAADAMISKAGGLSSTEAAVVGVPMVNLLVYTACEEKNVEFFESHGMSVRAEDAFDAVSLASALITIHETASRMREMQKKYINPYAAACIVDEISQDKYKLSDEKREPRNDKTYQND